MDALADLTLRPKTRPSCSRRKVERASRLSMAPALRLRRQKGPSRRSTRLPAHQKEDLDLSFYFADTNPIEYHEGHHPSGRVSMENRSACVSYRGEDNKEDTPA